MTMANPASVVPNSNHAAAGGAAHALSPRAGRSSAAPSSTGAASCAANSPATGPVDTFAAMLESMLTGAGGDPSDIGPAGASVATPAGSADAAQDTKDDLTAAQSAAASPQPPIAPSALMVLPAPVALPALATAAGSGQDARAASLDAAAGAGAATQADVQAILAQAKPGAPGGTGAMAPAGTDSGPLVAPATAGATHATESFAALLAKAGPGKTGSSGEHSASALHLAMDAQLASVAQAQGSAAAPAPTPTSNAVVHQAALPSRPLDAAFAGDLAAQVRTMVDAGAQRAELHLNPPDLGPIHIELSLNAQSAEIHFAAAHSMTRDGISQALPALREMLAGQGLNLGHAGVSSGQQGQAFADAQRQAHALPRDAARSADRVEATSLDASAAVTLKAGRGMLDLYA